MIVYLDNPKASPKTKTKRKKTNNNKNKETKPLQELISEFSQVPGHKINVSKSIMFLYPSYKPMETKM